MPLLFRSPSAFTPLGWEHINLTDDYVWSSATEAAENDDGFRALRPVPDPALLAA